VESASDTTPSRSSGERGWRWAAVVAAVATVGCGAFAVAAAVTSDDNTDTATETEGTGATGEGEQIRIADFAFMPPELSVPVGSTVTWTNEDDAPHSLSSDGSISSDVLDTGDSHTQTFDEAGTFDYVCGIHDFMTGTVTVTE
jgi:plastocyanin